TGRSPAARPCHAPERTLPPVPVGSPDRGEDGPARQVQAAQDEPAAAWALPARGVRGLQEVVSGGVEPYRGIGCPCDRDRFPARGRNYRDRGRAPAVPRLWRDHLPEPVQEVRDAHDTRLYLPQVRARGGDRALPELRCPGHLQPADQPERESGIRTGDG